MMHKKSGRKFSRTREHRIAMFRNLMMNLIRHQRIKTTDSKAKELKRIADKVVSLAKTNTLSNIRKARYYISDKDLLKRLFSEIGPRFVDKKGGYTRIYKVGTRVGDNANMSIIEFAFDEEKKTKRALKKKRKAGSEKKGQSKNTSESAPNEKS